MNLFSFPYRFLMLRVFLIYLQRPNGPKAGDLCFSDSLKVMLFDHGRRVPHFLGHLANSFDIYHPVTAERVTTAVVLPIRPWPLIQEPIHARIWTGTLPHRRPSFYREPDREGLINAPKIDLNSAENIFQKGALWKSNSAKTVWVFFRKAAHALFHPADQNEARKAKGLTE